MNDAYVDVFRTIVKDTKHKTGYELPDIVETYVVMLLANNIERVDFLPKESFAETYLNTTNHRDAKSLGDICLFVSGVFPTYGSRYGIDKSYYISIGSSSYDDVARVLYPELFSMLSNHFEFISEFIELSVNHQTVKRTNLFR